MPDESGQHPRLEEKKPGKHNDYNVSPSCSGKKIDKTRQQRGQKRANFSPVRKCTASTVASAVQRSRDRPPRRSSGRFTSANRAASGNKASQSGFVFFWGENSCASCSVGGGVPGGVGGAAAMCLNKNGYALFVCRDAGGRKSLLRSTNDFAGSCSQAQRLCRLVLSGTYSVAGVPTSPPACSFTSAYSWPVYFLFFLCLQGKGGEAVHMADPGYRVKPET